MVLDVFRGPKHQYGYGLGSIFRNLFRSFRPYLKDTGRYIIKKGLKGAYHTANDILEGADPKLTMKRRFSEVRQEVHDDVKTKVRKLLAGRGKTQRTKRVKRSVKCRKQYVKNKKKKKNGIEKQKTGKKKARKKKKPRKKKGKRKIKTSVDHIHGDLF